MNKTYKQMRKMSSYGLKAREFLEEKSSRNFKTVQEQNRKQATHKSEEL